MTTPQLRFDIPAYDRAMVELLHSGPSRAVREPQPLDQPLNTFEHMLTIPFEVIRTTNIAAFIQILYEFAQSYKRQMGASVFQTLDAVTDVFGSKVDAQGQPLSFDMINDMFEKLQLGVDDHGQAIPPTHIHPEMAQRLAAVQPTDAQRQRYATIMQPKQAEHNAQKRTRRLPR